GTTARSLEGSSRLGCCLERIPRIVSVMYQNRGCDATLLEDEIGVIALDLEVMDGDASRARLANAGGDGRPFPCGPGDFPTDPQLPRLDPTASGDPERVLVGRLQFLL